MAKTTMHEQLRVDTCQLLRYDINALTAAQEVRLERALVLRLEIDDLTAKKLAVAGAPFDVKSFVAASESLERLVGGDPEHPTAATHDFAGAHEELANFFVQRAERIEACEARESARLREENAKLREENIQLRTQLRAEPQQQPVKQPANVVPIDPAARANASARADDERAWRNYTYGGGAVVASAWSPPDHRR